VIEGSRYVSTNGAEIERVAQWMAAEEFPNFKSTTPAAKSPFDVGQDPDRNIDFTMLIAILNFAFTDFATSQKFEVDYNGVRYSDSEAMYACLHKAIAAGLVGPAILGGSRPCVAEDIGAEALPSSAGLCSHRTGDIGPT
jgi:hypothetical protein